MTRPHLIVQKRFLILLIQVILRQGHGKNIRGGGETIHVFFIYICPEACCRKGWGGRSNDFYHHAPQSTHRVAMTIFWRTFHHESVNEPRLRVGGVRPSRLTLSTHQEQTFESIYHYEWSCGVLSGWEGRYIPLFLLYPYMYSVTLTDNLFPRPGIFKQSMGARNRRGIGLSYRPARLYGLAKFIPWSRFPGPWARIKKRAQSPQSWKLYRGTVHNWF